MAVSKATRERWRQSWAEARARGEDPLKAGIDAYAAWEAEPFVHSAIGYWLKLEVWSRQEGLLVLTGVEPGTVEVEGAAWDQSDFSSDWINAQPFIEHRAFSVFPMPHDLEVCDFDGDADRYDQYLEHIERRRAVLEPHRTLYLGLLHKLNHSPSALGEPVHPGQWRPVAFLSWAHSIGFQPKWQSWAEERNLLPDQLDAMVAPFFDADSENYPELLHIAVRAWEAAQADTKGTPKQRIERFLEQRYPSMTASTRNAIALVANWQKAGGRPKQSE